MRYSGKRILGQFGPRLPMRLKALFPAKGPILAGIFLLLGIGYFGCGIKGPPVPQRQLPVPVVTDLTYQVSDRTVRLTWRLPGPLADKQTPHAAFGVYRYRTALAEPACDGCPQVFENVATVPYVPTDTHRYATDAPLDPGYRYVFKVRLETDGQAGPDSNRVQFDYLPDVRSGDIKTP